MLGKLKGRIHPTPDGPVELLEAQPGPVEVRLLDAQRTYRPDDRRADYVRVIYTVDGRAREMTVVTPWESMALLRSEIARSGLEAGDDDILGLIVVPWALDQVATKGVPSGETLSLDFLDGLRQSSIRDILSHYGFQPRRAPSSPQPDRPWMWED